MKSHALNISLLLMLLTACSPSPNQVPKIAESQRNALDKAKAVEATVQQSADEAKQKIDEQSQ
jgi:outer membrane PBP1 activator LpoA protein